MDWIDGLVERVVALPPVAAWVAIVLATFVSEDLTCIAAGLAAARASRKRVEDAHAARCTLAAFSEQDFQDTGIDPSDATGIPPQQPDLPFFMQSGFGRK